jgi:hypothetical protein
VNRVEAALRRIASDLNALHTHWALVGGFAVSVRSEPCFTRDVDVAVVVDDDQATERLVRLLIDKGIVSTPSLSRTPLVGWPPHG